MYEVPPSPSPPPARRLLAIVLAIGFALGNAIWGMALVALSQYDLPPLSTAAQSLFVQSTVITAWGTGALSLAAIVCAAMGRRRAMTGCVVAICLWWLLWAVLA